MIPETAPIIAAPIASTFAQPAVTPTSPAREAFRHIETSGLPFFIHVYIIQETVATAGAIVVVPRICASSGIDFAAAPLKPYQQNQRMKHPRAPRGIECPGIAFTFTTLPFASRTYFPRRGPRIAAPISAEIPPTM